MGNPGYATGVSVKASRSSNSAVFCVFWTEDSPITWVRTIMYRIVSTRVLAPTITRFEIEAPFVARKTEGGQFRHDPRRRPRRADPAHDRRQRSCGRARSRIIVQAIGKTTKELCAKKAGDSTAGRRRSARQPDTDRTSSVPWSASAAASGTPNSIPSPARCKDAGNTVLALSAHVPATSSSWKRKCAAISDRVFVTTDDGSYGRKGFVTDQLRDLLDSVPGIGAVYAIGPLPMMKAVANSPAVRRAHARQS